MEENFVLRKEQEEFAKRIDAENERQNRRISALEENIKEIHGLTVSVERMAVSMENMLAEQKRQGDRLEQLENEPIETYNQVKNSIITAIIGVLVGAVVTAVLAIL